jgi:hypothetical protein
MARAKKGKPDGPAYTPRKHLPILAKTGDVDAAGRALAENLTGGPFAALRIIRAAEIGAGYERDMDVPGLMATLREQGEAANAGNLAQAEAMLMNQATALQTVFARLVERGMGCSDVVPFEANLRMGLRAQSQCRATLETLAAIKNPSSVAFVRQANIAHGPQQVNNETGTRQPVPARPQENEIAPSKLLEASNGERMDTGAASPTGAANPTLEAVGAIHRAAHARRQGQD